MSLPTESSASADPVIVVEYHDTVAVVTLNRPHARNALNTELRSAIMATFAELEANDEVAVVVLTGAGPAFCAGLDLKELGSGGNTPGSGVPDQITQGRPGRRPFPTMSKPVIGAINGPAITGGFEIALNCDFLIASTNGAFADTHARVGVMPGWGLAVLLPAVVGFRRAREMSLSGNFMTANDAYDAGLVNHVVEPEQLLPFTLEIAQTIAANQPAGVSQMLHTYRLIEDEQLAAGWGTEADQGASFARREGFDPSEVERRRAAIVSRGRSQITDE